MGEKLLNRIFSIARVVVEHVITGVKRCRIGQDVLRWTTEGISDVVMEIACGVSVHVAEVCDTCCRCPCRV